MEKLWSPWRSSYIESFKTKKDDEECAFCNSANEKIEDNSSLVCHFGEYSFITLNLYPYNSGHLMVVPKRHLSDYLELSDEEMLEVNLFIKKSIEALNLVMKPHGYNIGVNLGRAAGAGIDQHIHFHIVPRWSGDSNFMPVLGDVKVISQDLLDTKKNLIGAFKKVFTK